MNNYKAEFGTVDILLKSNFETRAVDAFAISLIKLERQVRRIFTFLIYQNDSYGLRDGIALRKALASNNRMYFKHFIKGIDISYFKPLDQVYGENYSRDLKAIEEIINDRNKIFHGQVTESGLSRMDLIKKIHLMRKWCENLANRFSQEIDYDGFGRNAYRKAKIKIRLSNVDKFDTVDKYLRFLKELTKNTQAKHLNN